MKTALVVDTSRLARCVVKEMLLEQGLQTVSEMGDHQEALKFCETQKPDLVTLDLAAGSALELLGQIRSKLPQAKVLVLAEAGAAAAETALKGGAEAVVYKPLNAQDFVAALGKMKGASVAPAAAKSNGKARALVIDDSKVMRMMVRELLESQGLHVIGEAADVPEGIKCYDELKPDLVTLDMVMPGGSGMDVLKSIIARNPQARVIMVTSVAQAKVNEELMKAGAAAIMATPVTKDGWAQILAKGLPNGASVAPAPKAAASDSKDDGLALLKDVLESGGARCAGALTGMARQPWKPTGLFMHDHATLSKELASLPATGPAPIMVKMTVSRELPITGLFLASTDSANKMAETLAPGLPFGGDTIKVVAAEWANIMITNVLNAFSEALGESILCSPPELLEGSLATILQRAIAPRPGAWDVPLIGQNLLACKPAGAECEVWFVMSPECVKRLQGAKAKAAA